METNNLTLDARLPATISPEVRRIELADLQEALKKGLADFNALPTHLVFLCLIYPIVTLVFARVYAGLDILPLVFPLLAGYTLIGPPIATGMYELSRRREMGLETRRRNAFDVFRSPSIILTATLGAVMMAVYFVWLDTAEAIYAKYLGYGIPESVEAFIALVFNTPAGWAMAVVGSATGLLFAAIVLTLSVVSFPMLLDRDVRVSVAVHTSIRAVVANPLVMAAWGIIVAAALLIGSLPLFVGLSVVLPVLGHATWHLYRKVVGP